MFEADIDKLFSEDSYGYRQGKSAHDALKQCRKRCWQKAWVIDLDIKGFFDNIDHDLLMLAVDRVVEEKWIKRYIQRWLKANVYRSGKEESRDMGTPQRGVISSILSNLFLHYVSDKWMEIHHSDSTFERYADDIVIHVRSKSAQKTDKVLRLPLYVLYKEEGCQLTRPEVIAYRYIQMAGESDEPFFQLTNQHINRELKVLAKMANIEINLRCHIARHTLRTLMASRVSTPILKELMQHSQIGITMLYVHVSGEIIKDELNKVK